MEVHLWSGPNGTGTETNLTIPEGFPIALGTNINDQTESVEGPVGTVTQVFADFVNGQCSGTLLASAVGGVIT